MIPRPLVLEAAASCCLCVRTAVHGFLCVISPTSVPACVKSGALRARRRRAELNSAGSSPGLRLPLAAVTLARLNALCVGGARPDASTLHRSSNNLMHHIDGIKPAVTVLSPPPPPHTALPTCLLRSGPWVWGDRGASFSEEHRAPIVLPGGALAWEGTSDCTLPARGKEREDHWKRLPEKGATTGSIIGAIIGVILLLALIATAVVMIRKHRNKDKSGDGPPNYKPPPPKKTGGSTEVLNAGRENVTESHPLNHVYYETNDEPITNLDAFSDEVPGHNEDSHSRDIDDDFGHPDAPSGLDESVHPAGVEAPGETLNYVDDEEYHGREEDVDPRPLPSRGDSFMSPAMYV
ncbi:hypothetical protein SKAU_G00224910 [Synaphobranchus kaupii]|uniref:Uncharacterized protein n=1 Tax=Synaphobranchus kaupii TaxID=118154 RepID=A0A9Q1FBF5_SYNKA|nr:hypothetical protein SKAU_G00224910 [Synaphobranchus kaupii]